MSTNIAEASLTIDDVSFVIDCGKAKEKTFDHTLRISQLTTTPIARSNAEQRCGRAGRCRNGYCFRLYSSDYYAAMAPTQQAEMKRAAIVSGEAKRLAQITRICFQHEVCLHARMFASDGMGVREFLQLAPEPPEPAAVERSLEFLESLGALFTTEVEDAQWRYEERREPELTQLGRIIASLPLEPQLGENEEARNVSASARVDYFQLVFSSSASLCAASSRSSRSSRRSRIVSRSCCRWATSETQFSTHATISAASTTAII